MTVANKRRGVAQLVACLTGGQEAAGSSPVTPTMPSVLTAFEIVRTLGSFIQPFAFGSS